MSETDMTLQEELELSVAVCRMTQSPEQRRILMDRVRHYFDREHEHCWEDETCHGVTVGYCEECKGWYCAKHMGDRIHGMQVCGSCLEQLQREWETTHPEEYDGPRWGDR